MEVKRVALSQRVDLIEDGTERRDSVDQRWIKFLDQCGCLAIPVPNRPESIAAFLNVVRPDGVLLTGGNDLVAHGGDAPERDDTEALLIDYARLGKLPLMGVCRGMQMLQHRSAIGLEPVEGHVTPIQIVESDFGPLEVNSYHRFGSRNTTPEWHVWAKAADGIVKAIRHVNEPILGLMWHPERLVPFSPRDIMIVRNFFRG